MNFVLSEHLLKQALEREIDLRLIEDTLANPDQIVDDESGEVGQKVYQSIVEFSENKTYLVRVCVNMEKQPNVAKTVYLTTKIRKYYEGKI